MVSLEEKLPVRFRCLLRLVFSLDASAQWIRDGLLSIVCEMSVQGMFFVLLTNCIACIILVRCAGSVRC